MMHSHGADGTGHDEVTMPGLRGRDATPAESADLAVMFRNYQTLTRGVVERPNGIRTLTRAADPAVMEALTRHVAGMIQRVAEGRDPQIVIQSPTLDIFFARPGAITTDIAMTDAGIVVTQTSTDRDIVAALHTHAAEVSDMAARGMQAVHERLMRDAGHQVARAPFFVRKISRGSGGWPPAASTRAYSAAFEASIRAFSVSTSSNLTLSPQPQASDTFGLRNLKPLSSSPVS